ncbi:MAG: hypothetical protein ACI87E_003584, partial [Mariniblastus sp.]
QATYSSQVPDGFVFVDGRIKVLIDSSTWENL